ncbi:SLC13 family permease [Arenivirga flava]|uniref:Arsenic transporter n=1 Tax=Arenivirga flava TaxID=1930060 RepID=A0AA37UC53_9MICO|nr:SLC13 family permease [Arenivirga flava]GMA27430.1 arsenic transporter [Arenivirga flava]
MRLALIGLGLLLIGGVAVAAGVLPLDEAAALGERVWPVLLFAIAITVVAELAASAGVFSAVAERLAGAGRGRGLLLWALAALLALVVTVFFSIDTTAVLLTPVVIALARHARMDPAPFALTAVWLASTGSLLLPVSNLTNLLAQQALEPTSTAEFAARMALPALVAAILPCVAVLLLHRRQLLVRYEPVAPEPAADPVLLRIATAVLVLLLPLLLLPVPVWLPALGAATGLVLVFAVRRRSALRAGLVPWGVVVFACGLFLAVEAAHAAGLTQALASVLPTGDGPAGLLGIAGIGLLGANALDNLPAYLALEPIADSPLRLAALLIGVNAGAVITPWASLAVLLWHERLRSAGVRFPWRRFIALGAVVAPITVVAATATLLLR